MAVVVGVSEMIFWGRFHALESVVRSEAGREIEKSTASCMGKTAAHDSHFRAGSEVRIWRVPLLESVKETNPRGSLAKRLTPAR